MGTSVGNATNVMTTIGAKLNKAENANVVLVTLMVVHLYVVTNQQESANVNWDFLGKSAINVQILDRRFKGMYVCVSRR